jgi:hypothetical protein
MSVNTTLSGLSQTAASNGPDGTTDAPSALDDAIRNALSFIAQLRDGKGHSAESDVASAATCDIGAANSHFVRITGTTGISSLGTNYNGPRFIRFAGALTLTHNASTLILPGGANIVTAAGDTCVAVPKATSGTADGWYIVQFVRASWPAFSAYRSTGQTIGSTFATIGCDAEEYDTTASHAAGVFTAPVAGIYEFKGYCGNSTTACAMNQRFVKNAASTPVYYSGAYAVGNVNTVSMAAQIQLAVGDTVSYQVTQSTSQSISTGLGGNFFQGALVRPL